MACQSRTMIPSAFLAGGHRPSSSLCLLLPAAQSCEGIELWQYRLLQFSPWAFSTTLGDRVESAKVLSSDACMSVMCDRDVHMQVKQEAPLKSCHKTGEKLEKLTWLTARKALCQSCCPCSVSLIERKLVSTDEHLIFLISVSEMSPERKNHV